MKVKMIFFFRRYRSSSFTMFTYRLPIDILNERERSAHSFSSLINIVRKIPLFALRTKSWSNTIAPSFLLSIVKMKRRLFSRSKVLFCSWISPDAVSTPSLAKCFILLFCHVAYNIVCIKLFEEDLNNNNICDKKSLMIHEQIFRSFSDSETLLSTSFSLFSLCRQSPDTYFMHQVIFHAIRMYKSCSIRLVSLFYNFPYRSFTWLKRVNCNVTVMNTPLNKT